MSVDTGDCGVRAAQCTIDNRSDFLQTIQEIGREFNTHIICFNADLLAGRRHAETAVRYAIRSFKTGEPISNTLEMEALLYAAGSRQCNVAASFGLHEGENHLWVCCYPVSDDVWCALDQILQFREGVAWAQIDDKKRELLMQLFGVTYEEIASLGSEDRIVDLVLERVALLQVMR